MQSWFMLAVFKLLTAVPCMNVALVPIFFPVGLFIVPGDSGASKQPIRMENGFAHFAHFVSSLCSSRCE